MQRVNGNDKVYEGPSFDNVNCNTGYAHSCLDCQIPTPAHSS